MVDAMGEPQLSEVLSEGEARFDRARRRLGLWLGPPLGVAVWLAGDDSPAQRLAGVMAFAAAWWICEAVPVAATSLLAAAATVVLGLATPREAFGAFGHPLLFLFVGSFFLAEAMKCQGLGDRLARAAFRVARTELGVMAALSGAAFVMSMWMSNTAATAVTLPIALAVARASGRPRFGAALVLAIAYGASVGGIGTPVGTPPNLLGLQRLRDLAGTDISFLRWMALGVPLGVVMMGFLWVVLAFRFGLRPGVAVALDARAGAARRPWSGGEVAVTVAFGVAVVLWVLPGALALAAPGSAAAALAKARLGEETVALLAAGLLFVWPVRGAGGERRPALTWDEATRIDWGTILLFGGGILLGDLAGDRTGLAQRWGDALVAATGADSLWAITALATGAAILLSEATNNTATATLMVPLALSLAKGADVALIPPALGATLGASFGFMLPISTAPNAMAYGTRQVSIGQMARTGILFDLIGFAVIVAGLRILCPALGLL